MSRAAGAALAVVAALLSSPADAAAERRLAVFDVRFFDTSHEPVDQTADHARRVEAATRQLREELSGAKGIAVVAPRLDACAEQTPSCLFEQTRSAGAGEALTLVVHKSSSLILQGFLRVTDVEANRVLISRDINFRGDTDDAWRRAVGFLAREIVAAER